MIEDDLKKLSRFYSPFEEEREARAEIYGLEECDSSQSV